MARVSERPVRGQQTQPPLLGIQPKGAGCMGGCHQIAVLVVLAWVWWCVGVGRCG